MKKLTCALMFSCLLLLLCGCNQDKPTNPQNNIENHAKEYMIEYIYAKTGDSLIGTPEISVEAVENIGESSWYITGTASLITTENSSISDVSFTLAATKSTTNTDKYTFTELEIDLPQ